MFIKNIYSNFGVNILIMVTWVKLIDEKPIENNILHLYKCLCVDTYGNWEYLYLRWTDYDGFQYPNSEYPTDNNVAYWLKVEEPNAPILEAEKLKYQIQVFFDEGRLIPFAKKHNIEIFESNRYNTTYIISGVSNVLLDIMMGLFPNNNPRFMVRQS